MARTAASIRSEVVGVVLKLLDLRRSRLYINFYTVKVSCADGNCSDARQATPYCCTCTSPNSFSMTAIRFSRCTCRRWLSMVVLPDPKKPVRMVTGT